MVLFRPEHVTAFQHFFPADAECAKYLEAIQTPGQSALQFHRQLGLTHYETTFGILHPGQDGNA
ncbi:hypothetical protein A4U49_09850 [Acidithiobacillus ferrivorans]|nr:hypothetical protein A4U49_09850 [Acidithiobacillus ferrivorans]